MSFPEHLSSPAWPLLASLSVFWLRLSEKLSSLRSRDIMTLRHGKSKKKWQTDPKGIAQGEGEIKSANQAVFRICSSSITAFDIVFPASQHPSAAFKVLRVRWVMVLSLSVFWWCSAMLTVTHTHTYIQHSWMGFSEVCAWIIDTVGACQVAIIRPTELHCCLLWCASDNSPKNKGINALMTLTGRRSYKKMC